MQRKNSGNKVSGTLFVVATPIGNLEDLTLRARRILEEVPLVACEDTRQTRKLLTKYNIQKTLISYFHPRESQKMPRIIKHLKKGEDCAFVNVGDPLLYGTFIHIMETLRNHHPGIDIEVIPGISSVSAAAARTLVPLASDDDNIAIISGSPRAAFIRETLNSFDTVVFLKVNKLFDRLLGILEELDLVEKCVYVRRCTTGEEELIYDVGRLKGEKVDYFSLLIVRK